MKKNVIKSKKVIIILAVVMLLIITQSIISANIINVTSYGAVPDDMNDDIIAINNAINAASSGDTVYFPMGAYLITDSIRPKSYMKLEGCNQLNTIIKYDGNENHSMVYMSHKTNIEICRITLDGNNNINTSRGIQAQYGSKIFSHDLRIINFINSSSRGIYFSVEVTHSIISNNIIRNVSKGNEWGCGIRIAWRSSCNKVVFNTITEIGRGGILCNNDSTNLIIQNNNISNMHISGMGVEVWENCNGALIENNTMDYWLSIDSSDGCAIRRNVISEKNGKYGYCGLELAKGRNNIYTHNIVDDGSKIGISISNDKPKEYIFWAYNTIKYANTWGLQMMGENDGASYQYFYMNKFLYTAKNHPNALYPNEGHGFRLNGNCHYITLEQNYIEKNGRFGINFCGPDLDQLSFVNNIIRSNEADSVQLKSFNDLEWNNNSVYGNGQDIQLSSVGFANQKPTASFTCVDSTESGMKINFQSTSSDPDGNIKHVLWDFDDGLPSTNLNPSYTYTKPGNYQVSLLVWDDNGRGGRAEKIITIGNHINEDDSPEENSSPKNSNNKVKFIDLIPNPIFLSQDKEFSIEYILPYEATISIKLYDLQMNLIKDLYNGKTYKFAGNHKDKINTKYFKTEGLYIYIVEVFPIKSDVYNISKKIGKIKVLM